MPSTEHTFTLILNSDPEPVMDALCEAGCDDALFGSIDGVPYAEFTREATSLLRAVTTAIRDIEKVEGLRVHHVEPDDFITIAEIARRLGRTSESIRLLATGKRGQGFPVPISHLPAGRKLWRWSDIAGWAGQISPGELRDAHALAALGAALAVRNQTAALGKRDRDEIRKLAGLAA